MNWSNCTITLNNSPSFIRLSFILHAFALLMLYDLALFWPIKLLITLGLLLLCIRIYLAPASILKLKHLSFSNDEWTVCEHDNSLQYYDKHRVLLELGIFFLLELSGKSRRKVAVVFFDQLDSEDYRLLRLMEHFF